MAERQVQVPAERVLYWIRHLAEGARLTGIDYTGEKFTADERVYYTLNTVVGDIVVSMNPDAVLALLLTEDGNET